MESATGGLLASTLTDAAGASDYFLGGLITYATQQKISAGVPAETIEEFGVVSSETAEAMAAAARGRMGSDYGVGVTGALGPDPADGEPPGTVFVAVVGPNEVPQSMKTQMSQGRAATKRRATTTALLLLRRTIQSEE